MDGEEVEVEGGGGRELLMLCYLIDDGIDMKD